MFFELIDCSLFPFLFSFLLNLLSNDHFYRTLAQKPSRYILFLLTLLWRAREKTNCLCSIFPICRCDFISFLKFCLCSLFTLFFSRNLLFSVSFFYIFNFNFFLAESSIIKHRTKIIWTLNCNWTINQNNNRNSRHKTKLRTEFPTDWFKMSTKQTNLCV